jgi:hypothetical protein
MSISVAPALKAKPNPSPSTHGHCCRSRIAWRIPRAQDYSIGTEQDDLAGPEDRPIAPQIFPSFTRSSPITVSSNTPDAAAPYLRVNVAAIRALSGPRHTRPVVRSRLDPLGDPAVFHPVKSIPYSSRS